MLYGSLLAVEGPSVVGESLLSELVVGVEKATANSLKYWSPESQKVVAISGRFIDICNLYPIISIRA